MQSIEGKVYVVTGGGGAIGREVVSGFVAQGARVVSVDRTLDIAAAATGAEPLAADLSTVAGAQEMVRATTERTGRVDGLVHTVGGFALGRVEGCEDTTFDSMFNLNVRTLLHALGAVLPALRARGDGFVAGFSSMPGWTGTAPGSALYGASKSAVATLLRSLDDELRGTQIKVAIVYPMGAVDTPANRRDRPDFDPAGYIDPVDIADTLVFAAQRGPRARLLELPIWPAR
jgi:NADP-dependent 3-hydroxy acid dehydrogenase YdfG